jgi:hypothetical protein
MSKIEFKNCKIKENGVEQNYKDYVIKIDVISEINWDIKQKQCSIALIDGNKIEVQYYDNNVVS